MPAEVAPGSARGTVVVLVEADSYARLQHEVALLGAGYQVRAFAVCPGAADVFFAAIVLTDAPSFDWLRDQALRRFPPIVVLSDDDRAGVTACLHGAAAWVPAHGQPAYLLDTVGGVLNGH